MKRIVHVRRFFNIYAIRLLKEGGYINSFMSWVGGKKALRDEIITRFPTEYSRYIEVFGGGGWVLFHKPIKNDFEVYNDFNANLSNLYRCVRDNPEELINELTYTLNSRRDFEYIRKIMKEKADISDVKRAAYFYQVIRQSYASGLDSFGSQPHSMWNNFPLIYNACSRLQKVVIENKDFEKLINHYDRIDSFFYCDPPYYATEDYYEDVGFTEKDHERLANALCNIEGRFLLSYNDCPKIRELYSRPGITIETTSRLNNIAQRFCAGAVYDELLISNYDTTEFARSQFQLSLYDISQNDQNILKERKLIYKN